MLRRRLNSTLVTTAAAQQQQHRWASGKKTKSSSKAKVGAAPSNPPAAAPTDVATPAATDPTAIAPEVDKTLDDETRSCFMRIKPESPQRYVVEVATTSSSSCRFCGLGISANTLRVGALINSGSGDFVFPSFAHVECMSSGYRRGFPLAMRDWDLVQGVARLSPADMGRVAELVCGEGCIIDPTQVKALTQQSTALSMAEAALREENAKSLAARVIAVYGERAEKILARHPKGPSKPLVLTLLADALVFGPSQACEGCGSGLFKPTSRGFECMGHIDEYTRCTHTQKTVKREPGNAEWAKIGKQFAVPHIKDDCILHPRIERPAGLQVPPTPPAIDVFEGLYFGGFSDKPTGLILPRGGNMISKNDARPIPTHCIRLGDSKFKAKAVPEDAPLVSTAWIDHCVKLGTTIHTPQSHKLYKENGPRKDPTEDLGKFTKLQQSIAEERAAKSSGGANAGAGGGTSASKQKEVVVTGAVAVDSEVPDAANYKVFQGPRGDAKPWHASLTKTDFAAGRNSFYILQLLQDKRGQTYVYRRWGRVSEFVGGQKLEHGNEADFKKLFFERTGNDWDAPKFEKKPGLMDMVHVDYDVKPTSASKVVKSSTAGVKIEQPTRRLMKLMFDKDVILENMRMMKIDTEKLPLGNLSRGTLETGQAILGDIRQVLDSAGKSPTAQQQQQLLSLSNRYYSKVPQRIERSDAAAAILNTVDKVGVQFELLRDLMDIVETKTLIEQSTSSADPEVANMLSLKTDFQLLPSGQELTDVRDYFKSTQGSTHNTYKVLDVWRIARQGEADRFKPWAQDPNRKLLWHGSRLTNWVAILTQGLRIAPPEAPVSGYMFGKGIYFADMMSKSANYCHIGHRDDGLMALAEVALGEPHVLFDSDSSLSLSRLPKGCRSTFALGRNGPRSFDKFSHLEGGVMDGLQVPVYSQGDTTPENSKTRSNRGLWYNEYIVYDVAQVRLRYLLRIKLD